ncbi:MAG: FG-GAP and VCBS repeat-containing protein [Roseimicrobium sp.]
MTAEPPPSTSSAAPTAKGRRLRTALIIFAGMTLLVYAWWHWTRTPYDSLIEAWSASRSEGVTSSAVHLGALPHRRFAMANEDGTLQVFSETSPGVWKETWRDAFPKRVREIFVTVPRDESMPKNWWEKIVIRSRRVVDPDYQMDMAGSGSVVTRAAFNPEMLFTDLDQDGVTDLLVADERLWMLKGTADGRFTRVWESPDRFAVGPQNLLMQDMNGDGSPEVVLLNYLKEENRQAEDAWHSVLIYGIQKHESATWQVQRMGDTLLTDPSNYHSTSSIVAGDFDGDSVVELLVGNDNGWVWILEQRDGKLQQTGKPWQVPAGGACNLSSGDLNGDGKLEMLIGTNGGNIYACAVDADGAVRVLGTTMAGRLAYSVCSIDVDGNGAGEMMVVRGKRGYADMKKEDVVAELWTLDEKAGTLVRRWGQQVPTQTTPVATNLDGGPPEVMLFRNDYRPRVLRPTLPPAP